MNWEGGLSGRWGWKRGGGASVWRGARPWRGGHGGAAAGGHGEAALSGLATQMLFPKGVHAPWDPEGAYTQDTVQLFAPETGGEEEPAVRAYQCSAPPVTGSGWARVPDHPSRPLSPKPTSWCHVPTGCALAHVLRHPKHVVHGIPTLYVVARGTEFFHSFMDRCGKACGELKPPPSQ